MNRIAFYYDLAGTKKISENNGGACSDDLTDSDQEESVRYLTGGVMTGTQFSRLIDASCKAFFLRRGLDPDLDRLPSPEEIGIGGKESEETT